MGPVKTSWEATGTCLPYSKNDTRFIHSFSCNLAWCNILCIIFCFHPPCRCVCKPGYELDPRGGGGGAPGLVKKCVDIDECSDPRICSNGGHCRNFPGSFQCLCPPGSVYNEDTLTCQDENECEDNADSCGSHGRCLNQVWPQTQFLSVCFFVDPPGNSMTLDQVGHCSLSISSATKPPHLGLGPFWTLSDP